MATLKKPLTEWEISAPKTTVCVTGCTGFVAGPIVQRLLAAGHTVHATCRSPEKEDTVEHLKAYPGAAERLKLFKADLLDVGSFDAAVQGCEYVIHTASPFLTLVAQHEVQEKLIDPALKGTENVLGAVNKTPTIKRVVLTSSVAAIYGNPEEFGKNHKYTEEDWNPTCSETVLPYYYSKKVAEEKAWEMAKAQDRWDLVVINPGLVTGPPASKRVGSESVNLILQITGGLFWPAVPQIGLGVVDVRDVAAAHCIAMVKSDAKGRHICISKTMYFEDIIASLHKSYPQRVKMPFMTAPKFLLWLIAPMVGQRRDTITHGVGPKAEIDNSKIKRELGMEFIELDESLKDSMEGLIAMGFLKA